MAHYQVSQHPKFARLKRRLGIPTYAVLGILEGLWHFATLYTPKGDVGRYSDEEIASWLEWPGDETHLVESLVGAGWLDSHPMHRLVVHDWHQFCADFIHQRLGRAVEHFANGERPKLQLLGRAQSGTLAESYRQRETELHRESGQNSSGTPVELRRNPSGTPVGTYLDPNPNPNLDLEKNPGPELLQSPRESTRPPPPSFAALRKEAKARRLSPSTQSLVAGVDLLPDPDPDPDGRLSQIQEELLKRAADLDADPVLNGQRKRRKSDLKPIAAFKP